MTLDNIDGYECLVTYIGNYYKRHFTYEPTECEDFDVWYFELRNIPSIQSDFTIEYSEKYGWNIQKHYLFNRTSIEIQSEIKRVLNLFLENFLFENKISKGISKSKNMIISKDLTTIVKTMNIYSYSASIRINLKDLE